MRALWLLIVLLVSPALALTERYVSPTGNDTTGTGAIGAPWQTLTKARTEVRALNDTMTEDITVYLRQGQYVMSTPFALDASDSGSNGYRVIWKAYPGERPHITGGQVLTGWTAVGNGQYKTSVGSLRFRQMYVDGVRAVRARSPNAGSYNALTGWDVGGSTVQIPSSAITNWAALTEVEMVIPGKGVNQANLRIASFSGSPTASVVPREPERTRIFQQSYPAKEVRPYYFENALEFLDAEGEFYLKTSTNEVFYLPRSGENMATAVVVAPTVEQLWNITGTLGAKAHHITLYGLFFEHTTWLSPNSNGFIGDQAFTEFVEPVGGDEITSYPSVPHPAAVHIESATDIRLERNVFRHLGASGVNLWLGTSDVVMVGNHFRDIAATGIAVDCNMEGNPADTRKITYRPVIQNNYFTQMGQDYYQNVAIGVTYADAAVIEHNEVTDMPFTGISVGWGWADVANTNQDNLIRYNEVSDVVKIMADGSGIYVMSRQPGTLIDENYVHGITRYAGVQGSHPLADIFLDNGSGQITVTDNVLGAITNGSGQDATIFQNANGAGNVLSNNAGTSQTTIDNAGLQAAFADVATDPGEADPLDTLAPAQVQNLRVIHP